MKKVTIRKVRRKIERKGDDENIEKEESDIKRKSRKKKVKRNDDYKKREFC